MQLFGRDQFPCFTQVGREFLVTHARKLDADPTGMAHVRWSIEFLWLRFDQGCLDADRGGNNHSYVTVVVMIDRAHREYSFLNEECRFPMREFFPRLGQPETDPAHSLHVFVFCCHDFQ